MAEEQGSHANHGVSPTLRLWQLAESLRVHREHAGLTIEQVAERLKARSPRWSRSKVQRIETRLYAPQPAEVEQLTAVYELPAPEAAALVNMAREAREKGWWMATELWQPVKTMIGLEQAATTVRQFELALLPGLLQTSEYARALIDSIEPETPVETLESRVATRMARQHVLTQPEPLQLRVVLSEAALSCPVGGGRVWRSQLERLIELAAQSNITIQVLPFAVGSHAGLEGAFTLLTVPQLTTDIVYVEGPVGGVLLESQDDVRRCTMRFAVLSSKALSPSDSVELIRTTLSGQA